MNKRKAITVFRILTSLKFYGFVLSDWVKSLSSFLRRYEMLALGAIQLGKDTYIARGTALLAPSGTTIQIGDATTINDYCVIIGDVTIERYCLLSYNIYISSGNHQATLRPQWLIRDQDQLFHQHHLHNDHDSSQVHIEEDCWIGWGVFIKPGVYIGKGSVIGASTVVTRDVPPYSIQVGIPNRELSKRLEFEPPNSLDATKEEHLPYFYCGFLLQKSEIERSLNSQMLIARRVVRLMMKGGAFQKISLTGCLLDGVERIRLHLKCNQAQIAEIIVDSPSFQIDCHEILMSTFPESIFRSSLLSKYNELEIEASEISTNPRYSRNKDLEYLYGLKTISLS